MGSFNVPPVVVRITASDETKTAFASVNTNLVESRGAAQLFGEEIGVRLNRHLASVIANSKLLGPALELAFPVAAAIGFGTVVAEIADKVSKAAAEFFIFGEAEQKAFDAMAQQNLAVSNLVKETHKLANERELANAAGPVERDIVLMQQQVRELGTAADAQKRLNEITKEFTGLGAKAGALAAFGVEAQGQVEAYRKQQSALAQEEQMVKARFDQLTQSEGKFSDQLGRDSQGALKKFADLMFKIRVEMTKVQTTVSQLPDQLPMPDMGPIVGTGAKSPLFSGTTESMDLFKLQTDQNAAIKAAQTIFTDTRTSAEQYAAVMTNLNFLLSSGRIDQETFNRAMDQAQIKFSTINQVAQEFGQTLQSGLMGFFQEIIQGTSTLGQAFAHLAQNIAESIAKIITQLLIMKFIESLLGGFLGIPGSMFGGGGGFDFGSLLAGNLAGGGPVHAGSTYLVGEHGPELFTPTVGGKISAGGGGMALQVNIVNQSSQPVSGQATKPQFDGEKFVTSVILKDFSTNGPIRRAMG